MNSSHSANHNSEKYAKFDTTTNIYKCTIKGCQMTSIQKDQYKEIIQSNEADTSKTHKLLEHPWLNQTTNFLQSISNKASNQVFPDLIDSSAKMIVLNDIFMGQAGINAKFIILSKIPEMLVILKLFVEYQKCKCMILNSRIRGIQRQETIHAFNLSKSRICLLIIDITFPKINLSSADHIIFYDNDICEKKEILQNLNIASNASIYHLITYVDDQIDENNEEDEIELIETNNMKNDKHNRNDNINDDNEDLNQFEITGLPIEIPYIKLSNGNPQFPFIVNDNLQILSLGQIVSKQNFHTERYIYPSSYCAKRLAPSVNNINENSWYLLKIIDVGDSDPVFRIEMENDDSVFYEDKYPTKVVTKLYKDINKTNTIKISGPEFFGLTIPIVQFFIQNLQGVDNLVKYKKKNFVMQDINATFNPVKIEILNLNNHAFEKSVRSKYYVDKSAIIQFTNEVLNTDNRFICVTRPRRFGKTTTAHMLNAYYCKECDSSKLFKDLKITKCDSYEEHLNKYNVIYLDMLFLTSIAEKMDKNNLIDNIQSIIINNLKPIFPFSSTIDNSLPLFIHNTKQTFIVIIDEWDIIYQNYSTNQKIKDDYFNFLKVLFKGSYSSDCIILAYMTGILPIKNYGPMTSLCFLESSMINPFNLEKYFGFTEDEVQSKCQISKMSFKDMKDWYDGYLFTTNEIDSIVTMHIYNPYSVITAMIGKEFSNYWCKTGSLGKIKNMIELNEYDIQNSIIDMLGGDRCKINSRTGIDYSEIKSKDDILQFLVYFGYLSFDKFTSEVFIPNFELIIEFQGVLKVGKWSNLSKAIYESNLLLENTLNFEVDKVAFAVKKIHDTIQGVSYNNELSLSCVLSLAYYTSVNFYHIKREPSLGYGFVYFIFIPRKNVDKPALIIKLKCNESSELAINQIIEKKYAAELSEYKTNILMIDINYDSDSRVHDCTIVKYQKEN